MHFPVGPVSRNIPQRQGIRASIGQVSRAIKIDKDVRDTGQVPTTTLRGGLVLVLNSAGTKYIRADDAAAPKGTPASISAQETADTDWQDAVLTFGLSHGREIEVTLASDDDTDAEVVTALNGDAEFAAEMVAEESGGVVRVQTLEGGPDSYIKATADVDSIFGANGQEDEGSLPTFVVLEECSDILNFSEDASVDAEGSGLYARAHFIEADLIGLTKTAKLALQRNGCIFD